MIDRMDMDLDFFFPDKVVIERASGDSAIEARAQFSKPGRALLHGDQIIIAEGDVIVRKHKNGVVEKYDVLNVDYQQGFDQLPAVTKLALKKQGSNFSPHSNAIQNIYNVSGPNSRVNVQSHDASVNVVNSNTPQLFADLKAAISQHLKDINLKNQLLVSVREMETTQGSSSFVEKYQNFMALAANCITIVTPFLPALAQLLR